MPRDSRLFIILAALLLTVAIPPRPSGAQTASVLDIESILATPKIVKTLDDIKADDARTLTEQRRITEIPSPPFKERLRAEYYRQRMQELGFKNAAIVGDIMFVGTVGEEELGNLCGVKGLFRDHADIDGFISIDGLGITRVVNQATGSHRYEFI